MLNVRAVLCTVILVTISKNCETLQHEFNDIGDNVLNTQDSLVPDTDHAVRIQTTNIKYVSFIENPNDDLNGSKENKIDTYLEGNDIENSIEDRDISDEEIKRRVAREANSNLYPNLPSNPPYNQFQQYPNYPTYNYSTNPYHQPANLDPAFGQNRSSYGNYGDHNQYPNSNYGNYSVGNNNPYGMSSRPPYSQPGQFNTSYSGYPQGSSYGSTNTNNNFNSGTGSYPGSPYNPHGNYSNRHPVSYDNSSHVPGYYPSGSGSRPHNVTNFNTPSGRPPYKPTTTSYPYYNSNTHHNTSYNGQYTTTPRSWFGQNNSNNASWRPPYQTPNNQYPNNSPYNTPTPYPYGGKPGQNNTYNQWSQNTTFSHNPNDRNPYRSPNDQNQQNYYPTPTPYGGGNNNQGPYGNSPYGYNNNQPGYSSTGNQGQYGNPTGYNNQYPGYNNNPGYTQGSGSFNLANNGYNPRIPDRPPYGQNSNLSNQRDPTKVSPEYFNSYK